MELTSLLQNFGLNEKQAEVYIALLQFGNADIQTIAAETELKRTTAYSVLDILIEKGLVYINQRGGHRYYHAENPRKLPNLLAEENKKLLTRQKNLIEAIPELTSIYNAKLSKPKVCLFEGHDGIKKIYNEMLSIPTGQEILSYEAENLTKDATIDLWVKDYITKRLNNKISHRAITEDSKSGRDQQKKDKAENRKTFLVNKDKFPFVNEINIFNNKIAIISFKELIGVVIESAEIAKTWKSIFELSWLGANKEDNS